MHTTNGSQQRYRDAERMELRSYVSLAGDVIAKVWPMTSVIARNPLQGFEHLPFEDAVERGEQLFGGSGTLSQQAYREAFSRGRIHAQHLDEALKAQASDREIRFGDRQVAHVDVLRAIMVTGACNIDQDRTATMAGPSSSAESVSVADLTEWLRRTLRDDVQETGRAGLPDLSEEWPDEGTMADWCDRTLGTAITDEINRQMIKWCGVFLDEGEASWVMPDRERTFYRAWKRLARYDAGLRLLGIQDAATKMGESLDQKMTPQDDYTYWYN